MQHWAGIEIRGATSSRMRGVELAELSERVSTVSESKSPASITALANEAPSPLDIPVINQFLAMS